MTHHDIRQHRIPCTVLGRTISVLDGVATIAPPYSVSDIQTTNEIVLQRLRRIVQQ